MIILEQIMACTLVISLMASGIFFSQKLICRQVAWNLAFELQTTLTLDHPKSNLLFSDTCSLKSFKNQDQVWVIGPGIKLKIPALKGKL